MTAATAASAIFLALAAFVVAMNWACLIANLRYRKKGIKKHSSTVPIVAQFFAALAANTGSHSGITPILVCVAVALADPALYSLLYLPIFLLQKNSNAGKNNDST